MMKTIIIYNGEKLDPEQEWVLENNELGYIILAKNNENFWAMWMMNASATTTNTEIDEYTMYCNVTEIHNKYLSFHTRQGNQIAFESNIHGTGSTPNMQQFDEIYIYDADTKFDSYYGSKKRVAQFIRRLKLERILK